MDKFGLELTKAPLEQADLSVDRSRSEQRAVLPLIQNQELEANGSIPKLELAFFQKKEPGGSGGEKKADSGPEKHCNLQELPRKSPSEKLGKLELYEKTAEELRQKIYDKAVEADGDQLWKNSKKERKLTVNGKYACAVSTSHVLEAAGVNNKDGSDLKIEPTVGGLDRRLRAAGWTELAPGEEEKAGYVKFAFKSTEPKWKNGGGSAHVGVIDEKPGYVWNNSKRLPGADGNPSWRNEPVCDAFADYDRYYVLKPPGAK